MLAADGGLTHARLLRAETHASIVFLAIGRSLSRLVHLILLSFGCGHCGHLVLNLLLHDGNLRRRWTAGDGFARAMLG